MEIVVAGGTGFIGRNLISHLEECGHRVAVIGRKDIGSEKLRNKVNGKDVIINLMGEPIAGRWTKKKRKHIFESRVYATKRLVDALLEEDWFPEVFIQASAVGIYDGCHTHSESSRQFAGDFLAEVVKAWENEACRIESRTRLVRLRMGIVLGRNGGMLHKLVMPLKWRIGVQLGNGRQKVSFIHVKDLVRVVDCVIRCKEISGVVNTVSPKVYTFRQLYQLLFGMLKPFFSVRVPDGVLKLIFGEGSKVLTDGQHVVPDLLIKKGFLFEFQDLELALEEILTRNQEGVKR